MWRIVEWSREKARGTIESDQESGVRAGPMVFDGAVALVDDFEVGELVHIEVEAVGEEHRVVRIWPDDPRFNVPAHSDRHTTAPGLSAMASGRAEEFLSKLRIREQYRIGGCTIHELVLHGDDHHTYPPSGDEIVALKPIYIELPSSGLEPKYIRLSRPAERDYLCGRVDDLDEEDISITLVDDEDRIYFIVARDFRYHDPRPRGRDVGDETGSA